MLGLKQVRGKRSSSRRQGLRMICGIVGRWERKGSYGGTAVCKRFESDLFRGADPAIELRRKPVRRQQMNWPSQAGDRERDDKGFEHAYIGRTTNTRGRTTLTRSLRPTPIGPSPH